MCVFSNLICWFTFTWVTPDKYKCKWQDFTFVTVLSYAESYPLPAHPNSAEALSSHVWRLINNPREKKAEEKLAKQAKKIDEALNHDTGRPNRQEDNSCNTFKSNI